MFSSTLGVAAISFFLCVFPVLYVNTVSHILHAFAFSFVCKLFHSNIGRVFDVKSDNCGTFVCFVIIIFREFNPIQTGALRKLPALN